MNTITRLQQLPGLFTATDVVLKCGMATKEVQQFLWRCKKKEYIKSFGGRSEVYANLIVDRNPNWDIAATMAMPSAIIIGVEALREHGWTTQIQRTPDLAVLTGVLNYTTDFYTVIPKNSAWYAKVKPVLLNDIRALPVLHPAWALADMLANAGGWGACGLSIDDLYLEDATYADTTSGSPQAMPLS